jgi:hypothetical protein
MYDIYVCHTILFCFSLFFYSLHNFGIALSFFVIIDLKHNIIILAATVALPHLTYMGATVNVLHV